MSVDALQLSRTLQALVDARLDTIDRMLLGWAPRQERLSIVREVESQVFELLHGRDREDLTRDDVLAVLARLDPPEAYLRDDEEELERFVAPPRAQRGRPAATRARHFKFARASGVLGISALGLEVLTPLLILAASSTGSEAVLIVLLFGAVVASFAASVLALVLGAIGRRGGAWAAVGMITGGLALLILMMGGIYLVLSMA